MPLGPSSDWLRERRFWRGAPDRDVDDELAFHLAMREAEYVLGFLRLLPDEAYLEAKRLKLMQVLSAGYDMVNIEGARKARIPICSNGGVAPQPPLRARPTPPGDPIPCFARSSLMTVRRVLIAMPVRWRY